MYLLTEYSRIFPAAYGFISLLFHGFLLQGAQNVSNKLSALVYYRTILVGSLDLG
jgi:hypothetical protein